MGDLARGGTNSPFNLAVVCSNHHSIFHRDKSARIVKRKGDNILVSYDKRRRKEQIIRDLLIFTHYSKEK